MSKHYVFVEGKTDKEVLDFFIKMKYSHLENVINIIPFEKPSRGGGKDYIPQIIKAAIHLNETKNIIALFDNDTNGIETKELLKKELRISNIDMMNKFRNIKILSYPNISFLNSYPVYNPISISKRFIVKDNINGKGGAIELYLPRKTLLEEETKELYPLRYYTYNRQVNKYQVGFSKNIKDTVMNNFRELKKEIKKEPKLFVSSEWENCNKIIKKIIKECSIKGEI